MTRLLAPDRLSRCQSVCATAGDALAVFINLIQVCGRTRIRPASCQLTQRIALLYAALRGLAGRRFEALFSPVSRDQHSRACTHDLPVLAVFTLALVVAAGAGRLAGGLGGTGAGPLSRPARRQFPPRLSRRHARHAQGSGAIRRPHGVRDAVLLDAQERDGHHAGPDRRLLADLRASARERPRRHFLDPAPGLL